MNMLFVIIGASASQLPFIKAADRAGFSTVVFDKNPAAPGAAIADLFYPFSTHDGEKIRTTCKQLARSNRLAGILTYSSYPQALEVTAQVAKELSLPHCSLEAVRRVTNKLLMKECFFDAGVASPEWIATDKLSEVKAISEKWHAPIIIKPKQNSAGSLGVNIAYDKSFCLKAFQAASSIAPNKQVIVEKFYRGSEFSVDGIICKTQPTVLSVSEKIGEGHQGGFLPLGYSMGTGINCNPSQRHQIEKEVLKAVRAIGIDNSFFGADVLLTMQGPLVLEVGILMDAKMDRLLSFSGIDVYGWRCEVATGKEIDHRMREQSEGFALRFLYADRKGFLSLKNEQICKPKDKKAARIAVEWQRGKGDIVGLPQSVADMLGWVIVQASNSKDASSCAKNVIDSKMYWMVAQERSALI